MKSKLKTSLFSLSIISFIYSIGQPNEFLKEKINSTALIYKFNSEHLLESHGVGFFMYQYKKELQDLGIPLITCKHITYHDTIVLAVPASDSIKNAMISEKKFSFIWNGPNKKQIILYFDGNNFLLKVNLKLDSNLFRHPTLDLAMIFCTFPTSIENDANAIRLTDLKGIPKSQMGEEIDLQLGNDVAFIGFPFGIGSYGGFQNSKLYSDLKVNPLVRKGMISWTSINSDLFLVDGFSFGGNSGSPIFSLPNFQGGSGKLIGMAIGHLLDKIDVSYIDSLGQQKATPYFVTPNNGLANCIPSFRISEFVNKTLDRLIRNQ